MAAILMYLKQLSYIYCTYLWLATLVAVNAQEVLQPKADELPILNEDTRGLFLADEGNKKHPEKSCGSPPDFDNGKYEKDRILSGDKITAVCNTGYMLVGLIKDRWCRDQGWDGRDPVCEVIKCKAPPAIVNGQLEEERLDSYDYSQAVSYKCNSGFSLIGSSTLYCSEDGTFKPDPPTCMDGCPKPEIPHASRVGGKSPPYKLGNYVDYKCDDGYTMKGEYHIVCGLTGWTPEPPKCIATVPETRSEFLQYSRQLTLDPNTVNNRLRLSEGNREITFLFPGRQSYPDHPDRFDVRQVLCSESVCERSYWEIEWRGDVSISVSYKNISRKGRGAECVFGANDQSWSLDCNRFRYSFRHNNTQTDLPVVSSSRIGVYVDPSAGTLSFYSVSGDTMILIHTVQTTFTQPLYPGFWIGLLSSVKLC